MGKKERALRERVLEALGEYDAEVFADLREELNDSNEANARLRLDLGISESNRAQLDARLSERRETIRAALQALPIGGSAPGPSWLAGVHSALRLLRGMK